MRIGFTTLLLILLAIGLVIGASFGGGVVLGRNTAKTPTPAAVTALGGQGAASGGAAGGTQRITVGQGGQAGTLLGMVQSVQGDTVTVQGADGNSAQYTTSPDTQVYAAAPSSLTALKQGDLVQLSSGQPDSSGHQTARSILVLPPRQAGAATASAGARGAGTRGAGAGARGTGTPGARRGGAAATPTAGAVVLPSATPIPVPSGTPISP